MAQDSVLQREMFNSRDRSAKGSGITSMVDDGSASEMTREQRLQMAKNMLAEAQMTQKPEYYFNTLAQGDRPAMTRPVASSAPPPAMQPIPPMQQMAQMQAAGVRPVGMAEGGLASLRDPRMEAVNLADLPAEGASESSYLIPNPEDVPRDEEGNVILFDPEGNPIDYFMDKATDLIPYMKGLKGLKGLKGSQGKTPSKSTKPDTTSPFNPNNYGPQRPKSQTSVPSAGDPSKSGSGRFIDPAILERIGLGAKTGLPSSFDDPLQPSLAQVAGGSGDYMSKVLSPTPDAQVAGGSGDYMSKVGATRAEETSTPPPAERKLTELEQIKADRKAEKDKNFWLGLMQAGLATAAGKSPDALQNIAQGGISGLQSYAGLEADSRKAEREDMAALRAQQQDDATAAYRDATLGLERKKIDSAPESVRAAAMAAGWNPASGTAPTEEQIVKGYNVLGRGKLLTEINNQIEELTKPGAFPDPDTLSQLRRYQSKLLREMGIGDEVVPVTGSKILGVQPS